MIKEDRFDQKIIEQIKSRKIFPRPRWLFILRNYGIWLAGSLAIIFGSISSALLIYLGQGGDLELHRRAGASLLEIFLLSLPFFWLAASVVFVYLAYLNLKNTDTGYRYSPWLIGLAVLLISLLAGFILYNSGLSRTIDNALGRNMPLYEYVANPQIGFWSDQKRGHLLGIIAPGTDSNNVALWDREQQLWLVDVSHVHLPSGLLPVDFRRLIGKPVGFWGKKVSNGLFEAQGFMPIRGGEGFFGRPGRPPLEPWSANMPPIRP